PDADHGKLRRERKGLGGILRQRLLELSEPGGEAASFRDRVGAAVLRRPRMRRGSGDLQPRAPETAGPDANPVMAGIADQHAGEAAVEAFEVGPNPTEMPAVLVRIEDEAQRGREAPRPESGEQVAEDRHSRFSVGASASVQPAVGDLRAG